MKFIKNARRSLRSTVVAYWTLVARIQFLLAGQKWPKDFIVKGALGLSTAGTLNIGENVTIVNGSNYNRAGVNHPTQLVAAAGAVLKIGSNVGMSGSAIVCHENIEIGDHVLLGVNASIYDSDLHPIDHLERRSSMKAKTAPVFIEDDVWLCANVLVLKGVRIGARSVIAANSVVTKDIPPDTLAAGNPASIIRQLA